MRRFKLNKLVRDNIVDKIQLVQKGNAEYKKFILELINKILEETKELKKVDLDNIDSYKEELADVYEALNYLRDIRNISQKEINAAMKEKVKKNGSFNKRHFIKTVYLKEDDDWVEYYAKKFKEIKS